MKDLIEALNIFAKYTQEERVTHCEHDTFYVCVDPAKVSDEDKKRLDELGFFESNADGLNCFMSFHFGSC